MARKGVSNRSSFGFTAPAEPGAKCRNSATDPSEGQKKSGVKHMGWRGIEMCLWICDQQGQGTRHRHTAGRMEIGEFC